MRSLILSNVPWGYGTPQVKFLKNSIEEVLGSDCISICPTYDSRPILEELNVESVITKEPSFSLLGLSEYLRMSAKRINQMKPDNLILVNPDMLFALPLLKYKPRVITYYGLEPLDQARFSLSMLRKKMKNVDIALFPESNRLKRDAIEFTNLDAIFEILNTQSEQSSSLNCKETDLIYAGTLDPGWIEFGYLEQIDKHYELKVFGDATEVPKNMSSILKNFYGLLSENDLRFEIAKSKFSIVCWKPNNFSLLNAAPNKLFQSLSCGTPVITYPYPQAIKLGESFSGIFVAEDFSIQSLIKVTKLALDFDDESYKKLVERIEVEFNESMVWSKQVEPYLKCLLGMLR
jgi:hypothetical protein